MDYRNRGDWSPLSGRPGVPITVRISPGMPGTTIVVKNRTPAFNDPDERACRDAPHSPALECANLN
jgi:hypothetical protein